MGDPWSCPENLEESGQIKLASILRVRAEDPQQREMTDSYLRKISCPKGGAILEIGCGTGIVTRSIASMFPNSEVVGLDPSPVFIQMANDEKEPYSNLRFICSDAKKDNFDSDSFDVIIFHTTLSHISDPLTAIKQAWRILKPNGILAVFDGDYTTASIALSQHDPLQTAVSKAIERNVQNLYLTRQLPYILYNMGFSIRDVKCYGFIQMQNPVYMLTLIDRGIDAIQLDGNLSREATSILKAEARRRINENQFYGQISFLSILSEKLITNKY